MVWNSSILLAPSTVFLLTNVIFNVGVLLVDLAYNWSSSIDLGLLAKALEVVRDRLRGSSGDIC